MNDYYTDRGFEAAPIYLADLDRCAPADALARESLPGRWQALSYKTEGFSGALLFAGPETRAPEVTYPLDARGWHAISIGIHPTGRSEHELGRVLVRLSGDRTFSVLVPDPNRPLDGHHRRQNLEELFWKVADLSGQRLVFAQAAQRVAEGEGPGAFHCDAAKIAYVKLVPLSDAEARELRADRARDSARRIFAHNDAFFPFSFRVTDAEGIRREIEPYRDGDFARIYWEVGEGDLLYYPTRVGRTPADLSVRDYSRVGERIFVEGWRELRGRNIDPLRAALDYVHELGLEFHASWRNAAWTYPPTTFDGFFGGGLYERRPDLHALTRDGRRLPRLSYAFPEVREFALAVLREVASYPIDGICLLYNRRPPYLDHEAPLIEGFKADYGRDPRDLEETDPDWLAYRGGVLTDFMRAVRRSMDEVAEKQGRDARIQVSACVLGTEEDNRFFGLDVETWAREGLIDTLIPYSPAPLALPVESDTWSDPWQVEPFVRMTRGTDCTLAINLMPRDLSAADYRRMAHMLYEAGVEHFFVWDCAGPVFRANYQAAWNALRRLGHRGEIEAWRQAGEPDLASPRVPLLSLGGWDMTTIAPG